MIKCIRKHHISTNMNKQIYFHLPNQWLTFIGHTVGATAFATFTEAWQVCISPTLPQTMLFLACAQVLAHGCSMDGLLKHESLQQ